MHRLFTQSSHTGDGLLPTGFPERTPCRRSASSIDEDDLHLLADRLNTDPEITFIVPEGPLQSVNKQAAYSSAASSISISFAFEIAGTEGTDHKRWKAVRSVDALKDGNHSLWHVPAGPLPLINKGSGPQVRVNLQYSPIPDPWAGWTGSASFGPGCHPWIRLEVWTRHRPYTEHERATLHELNAFWANKEDMLVVSDFQWTGGHFSPAPPQTLRWWNRMRNWMDRNAVRLRTNPGFWAFPSALRKLKGGMRYYSRNYDLDEAIRQAE